MVAETMFCPERLESLPNPPIMRVAPFDSWDDIPGVESIVDTYENGGIVVLDHHPLKLNLDAFLDIEFPLGDKKLKRLKTRQIKSDKDKYAKQLLTGDEGQRFKDEVSWLDEEIIYALGKLFPEYVWTRTDVSWKLSPSSCEDLHLDHFTEEYDDHMVRMFWNIDSYPRIWTIGRTWQQFVVEHDITMEYGHPQDVSSWINRNILKRTDGRHPSPEAVTYVIIPSGSILLVDSQKVSHAPLFGRRLCAVSAWADRATMSDPALAFSTLRLEDYNGSETV